MLVRRAEEGKTLLWVTKDRNLGCEQFYTYEYDPSRVTYTG